MKIKMLVVLAVVMVTPSVYANLSVSDVRDACREFVEQEESWMGLLTTSNEEIFQAGRCEGAIRMVVSVSRGCDLGRGEMKNAALLVSRASTKRSALSHIRKALGCNL